MQHILEIKTYLQNKLKEVMQLFMAAKTANMDTIWIAKLEERISIYNDLISKIQDLVKGKLINK